MPALFAQAAGNRNNNAGPPPEEILFIFAIIGGICLVLLIIQIFFLLTLSRALNHCRARNRTMEPGQVWLNLIPFFNIVWHFITVTRLADSLKREFRYRRWSTRGEDFGQTLGIVTFALPLLGGCFALAGLICGIIYWSKIADYSSQLAAKDSDDNYEDDEDDEYYEDDEDRKNRDWERR
jgi:hypothetical protein